MKRTSFNDSWLFTNVRKGTTEKVTLPHDAMIHDDRTPDSPSGSAGAYFVPGKYIYEKEFTASSELSDKHVELAFGSVYKDAEIFMNDEKIAEHTYGFTPFNVSIDNYLKIGSKNTIKVIANNEDMPNCRWYSGAGIYTPVYLVSGNRDAYINYRGIKVDTLDIKEPAVKVRTSYTSELDDIKVSVEIYDRQDLVASGEGAEAVINVPDAKLWSENTPDLYTAKVTLSKDGNVLDTAETSFGIRIVSWSKSGFKVNGTVTKLRGGCVHPDNGILGCCTYREAEERKVKILRKLGYNAIRAAHNPLTEEMLTACDKYGMYVMDEAFDMWYQRKNRYDYAKDFDANWKSDVTAMIDQDYNHPAVVMYSVGNELSEPHDKKGLGLCDEIIAYIKSQDISRAVTAGCNLSILALSAIGAGFYSDDGSGLDTAGSLLGGVADRISGSLIFNTFYQMYGSIMDYITVFPIVDKKISPFLDRLDIAGYNYGASTYLNDLKRHPDRIIVGSETFPFAIYKNWKMIEENDRIIGDFMWPSVEYIGETGLSVWSYDGTSILNVKYPYLTYGSGGIDLLCNPDVAAEYAAVVWGTRTKPYIGVRPANHPNEKVTKGAWRGTNARATWSWRGCYGNKTIVEVYTRAPIVKLMLNGKTIGIKKTKEYKALFNTEYDFGTLEAVCYDLKFHEVGRSSLSSATGSLSVSSEPEVRQALKGDIVFVPISIVGENGIVESNSDVKLSVTVENGELLGFGSSNFKSEEHFDTGEYTTFYGQALAAVRVGEPGSTKITVKADHPDIEDAETVISVL